MCELNKKETYLQEMIKLTSMTGQEDTFKCPVCDIEVMKT